MMPIATSLIYHPRYLDHDTGPGHPERPDRLREIVQVLKMTGQWEELLLIEPVPAGIDRIEAVHPAEHIRDVKEASRNAASRNAPASLDPDTVVSAASYEVALLAVGGALAACDAVMEGRSRNAFAAIRPPGHHAERDRAMGFCLFNNVAVAARYLQREHGLERILIVDWDVHHGNGTQHIFEADPTVFYISLHQHPLYPGTGRAAERGIGAGEGRTLNIPLPSASSDDDYRKAFERAQGTIDEFKPEFVLISAGFDAHRRDPLASMLVTEDGFRRMMRFMLDVAERHCAGRLAALLEGGYDLQGLALSVAACLDEMTVDRVRLQAGAENDAEGQGRKNDREPASS